MTRRSIVACALLVVLSASVERAEGQRHRCAALGTSEALALGWLTYSEAGVDGLEDAAALYEAIATMAEHRGSSWAESACAYSRRLFGGTTSRAPWILGLDRSGEAPRGWPSTSSWAVAAPQWAALLEHTEAIVRGDVPRPCRASDWGHPEVDAARIRRGVRRGWWEIRDCGETRNVFLLRSHLAPDPE